jgi:hypothetical protein
MWHVYVVNGKAYVPTVAKTEAGFFLDVEPVGQANLLREPLLRELKAIHARGVPVIPSPPAGAFPPPVVLKPMKLRSWSALMKQGTCFTLFPLEGGYEALSSRTDAKGRWSDDPESKVIL